MFVFVLQTRPETEFDALLSNDRTDAGGRPRAVPKQEKNLAMNIHSLHPHLALAIEAAQVAGTIISRGYGSMQSTDISTKGIGDYFSRIDTEAENAIIGILQAGDSASSILAEESAKGGDPSRSNQWIVDPLDGSAAFLFEAGKQLPSTLIAYRGEENVELGVMLFPLTGEGFCAVRGAGTFQIQTNGIEHLDTPTKLQTCPTLLSKSWVDMNQYSDAALETHDFGQLRTLLRSSGGAGLVTSQVPHSGIAARIILGREPMLGAVIHDNNPLKTKQEAWDVAVAQLMIEEAGGACLTLRATPYDFCTPEPFILANSPELALEIIELLY